jgi:hypothetical protein
MFKFLNDKYFFNTGNIFDAGATAVEEIRKNNKNFGLSDALQKIQERPWLIDDFDSFFHRLEQV